MSKTTLMILSTLVEIFLFSSVSKASTENNVMRVGVCDVPGARYALFNSMAPPSESGKAYMAIEMTEKDTYGLPTTLEVILKPGAKSFALPTYWPRKEIPLAACQFSPTFQMVNFSLDEVIRDFYVKAFFISGEPRPIDNIEDMIKEGTAIPLKLRILCKSDELTDDLAMCNEVTILDDIIQL